MLKILVVEDDKAQNDAVCSYLQRNGYDAVGCLDADAAYDALYADVFDLIISDIMMPKVDGFEFAATVRKLGLLKKSAKEIARLSGKVTGSLCYVV